MLSSDAKIRMIDALGSQSAGNEILGSMGFYGGFVLNSDASVKQSAGDIQAIPDSGGAPGTYRVLLTSALNSQVKSIDWFSVKGFTPRNPTDAETCEARVTGYNFDSTKSQWYITVQIALLSSQAVTATPPQNFVVGVRMAATLKSTSNPQ